MVSLILWYQSAQRAAFRQHPGTAEYHRLNEIERNEGSAVLVFGSVTVAESTYHHGTVQTDWRVLVATAKRSAAAATLAFDHRTQVRRAVIVSTVGTTIDGTISCSTARRPPSSSASSSKSDPLMGVLETFAVCSVGFIARPIGAMIFGHHGDRIGRKGALVATLLLTGLATVAGG